MRSLSRRPIWPSALLPHTIELSTQTGYTAVAWLIASLALALRVGVLAATHFTQEDALITLRYAQNIASGHGFVYNLGQHVLGTTTPLYTLLLALFAKGGANALLFGKLVNALADSALSYCVFRLLKTVNQEPAGLVAAFAIAVNPIEMRVAVSGQESSLVAFCGALIWLFYAECRTLPAFITAAILFLLRWDGVLLIGIMTIGTIVRDRKAPWRELGAFVLICAPWLVFAAFYFGSPIPVTLAAKTVVYGWYFQDIRFPELGGLTYRLYGAPEYVVISILTGAGLWRTVAHRWSALIPIFVWFVIYWSAFLVSKVVLFEWYFIPTLYVYLMFASIGLVGVVKPLFTLARSGVFIPILIAGAGLIAVSGYRRTVEYTKGLQSVEDNLRQPLGLWLKAHSKPWDSVMLEPIGYIGYYSDLRIIDMTGLVTPSVLPFYTHRNNCPWLLIAERDKPNWCVFRPGEANLLLQTAKATNYDWTKYYQHAADFNYSDKSAGATTAFIVYRKRTKAKSSSYKETFVSTMFGNPLRY